MADGRKKAEAVRPDATTVCVYDFHILGVRMVQPSVRGQRPGLEQERRRVKSSKIQNHMERRYLQRNSISD
jgi:hypothetical protein